MNEASSSPPISGLNALAAFLGVQTSYVDANHFRRTNRPEAVAALVAALLGAPVSDPRRLLAEATARKAGEILEPVNVAWLPGAPMVRLNLPAGTDVVLEAVAEDGRGYACHATLDEGRVASLPALPAGYYHLNLEAGKRRASAQLIVAPRRAYRRPGSERDWGLFVPLYALHSADSWGIGDLDDLEHLSRIAAGAGAASIGTLPLTANFLDERLFDPSPYSPASRLMWNEIFLDVTVLHELDASPAAKAIVASPDFAAEVADLNAGPRVEYRRSYDLKRRVLAQMACDIAPGRKEVLAAFLAANPLVDEYARFRARAEREGSWQSWPPATASEELAGDEDTAGYHRYVQFAMAEQLAAFATGASVRPEGNRTTRGSALYLDLPIGVHADGFDTWRWHEAFLHGARVGAAPDALGPRGQDWGFPPLNPVVARENGHAYFRAVLRHHMRYANRLRVDHVMGFHRLFVIPRGFDSRDGVFLRYPTQELYAILNLESHRNQTEIIGENLGTVPRYVNDALRQRSIAGMYVFPWEIRPGQDPPINEPAAGDIATLGTHDMAPFAAWWDMDDIAERETAGDLSPEGATSEREYRRRQQEAVAAYLRLRGLLGESEGETSGSIRSALDRLLAGSRARFYLSNLEDILGEKQPQNVPGTTGDHNWRRRTALSLEDFEASAEVAQSLSDVAKARQGLAAEGTSLAVKSVL